MELLEILLPLKREKIFFSCIAFLTGGNDIARNSLPATRYWDQMIQRQFNRLEFSTTVVADAGRTLALPPLRISHFSGFCLLPLDMSIISCDEIFIIHEFVYYVIPALLSP